MRRDGRSIGWAGLGAATALVICGLSPLGPRAAAQDEDDDGVGSSTPGDARAVLQAAITAMGGAAKVEALRAVALRIDTEGGAIQERHVLRLEGRLMHYASRGEGGAGFDVVVARDAAFICDRGPKGEATYVADLEPQDAREGAYERDVLFMPVLLPALLKDPRAGLEHKGKNSVGEEIVKAIVHPAPGNPGEPFVIRLRFAPDTHLLSGSMGTIPCGADQGKKRYLSYLEHKAAAPSTVVLPHRLSDARDRVDAAREFGIAWELDPTIEPTLFVKPTAVPTRREE